MVEEEPSVKEMVELWQHCVKFIKDQRIWDKETVYQSDRVIVNAYEFVGKVCDIVGYVDLPPEEEEED